MRISDWSSDVCSSDLACAAPAGSALVVTRAKEPPLSNSKSTFSAQPSGSRACAAKSLWIVMESCYEKDGETACPGRAARVRQADRKSTRLNPVTNAHLVCRLLLEKKKSTLI